MGVISIEDEIHIGSSSFLIILYSGSRIDRGDVLDLFSVGHALRHYVGARGPMILFHWEMSIYLRIQAQKVEDMKRLGGPKHVFHVSVYQHTKSGIVLDFY